MADYNQMREILEKLDEGVKSLFESDKYAEYLSVMSRFHNYSTRNTLLIYTQKPDAQRVAGYQSWKNNFKRQVKKGERGIKILAPIPFAESKEFEKLDPDTKQPILDENGQPVMETLMRMGARFKTVSVFDISQTDGEPLPELAETLTGDVERYELFMDALRRVSPLPIVFEPMSDQDGYCAFGDKIGIREGMSEVQTISAVIHEMAHANLHERRKVEPNLADGSEQEAKPKSRRVEEVEAESVSYVVCQKFGIETGANSFGYVANWSKTEEAKELHASLDTIRKAASEMIESIDTQYRALAKERGIDLNAEPAVKKQEIPLAPEPQTVAAAKTESPLIAEYANAKNDWLIGSNVLLTPVFYDGQYNRTGRRFRVKVEEPIGKYQIFSDDEGDGNKKLYFLTASGRITEMHGFFQREWSYELHKNVDVRPTEEEFDAAIIQSAEKFERDMSDPEKWVRYQDAAVVNRLDDCDIHNIPVREAREAENIRRQEIAERERKEAERQEKEKFDGRIDEIADAIHKGKTISVGYKEHEFDGKNPVLDLFKLYGIELPLRTQGWVNTGLAELNDGSYRYYKSKHKGDSTAFHKYLNKLREAINKTPIEQLRSNINQKENGGESVQYSELQQKGFEFAKRHEHLPLQERLNIIAKAFNAKSASVSTVPCTGKYRGMSDVMLTLDNGATMGIGLYRTPEAKKESTISECVNNTLAKYNPETVAETKQRAAAALKVREAEDNSNAEQRGLKTYKFLNVELSDGSNPREGLSLGWYYLTLAIDGRVFGFVESGLNSEIARGEVTEQGNRPNYFVAGGLKDSDVDFVFNNVGHSSHKDHYKMIMNDAARERAEAALAKLSPEAPANGVYAKYSNIVAEKAAQFAVSSGTLLKNDEADARRACDQIVNRVVNDLLLEAGEHYPLFKQYMESPDFKARLEDYAFIKAYLEPKTAERKAEQAKPERVNKTARANYEKFAELFPNIASGEYSYMKLESKGFEPLSVEYIGDNRISVMHTYKMNGDLMYDPMIVFEIDKTAQTLTAVEFEQSMPPLYQRVTEDNGDGQSIDGNGNEHTVKNLQGKINEFSAEWFNNIESQGYMPITATLADRDENARVTFDEHGNPILPEPEPPETPQPAITMPDPAASFAEMCYYGYTYENMLPLHQQTALEIFDADKTVYLLYPDNTEAMALDREEIKQHDGLFGIEKEDWERMQTADTSLGSESRRESELLHETPGMFGIYQIRSDIDEARNFRFAPMRELEALGLSVDRANYELVYAAPLAVRDTQTNLNKIFADFQGENPERPADYAARSPSVSDVIVLQWRGEVSAHFVDSIGFKELPHFTGSEREQPKTAEREPAAKGQTFYQVEKRGNVSGEPSVQKGKPDFLAKIEANKQRVARESQPGAQKNTEREVRT